LKAGWQSAWKQALRTPLTAEWLATVREWVQQATISEGLRSFQEPLRWYGDAASFPPEVVFAQQKTSLLRLLTSGSQEGLKRRVASLQFYCQYLAIFPERFIAPLPELSFSETLVKGLRQAPLDLRQELYFNGPTTAYELKPDFFYYAVSQEYTAEVVRQLPAALHGYRPPDLDLFLSLAQACASGEIELLVMDN
jgi:hypothetical protein